MSYTHLNTFERTRIELLSKHGYSNRAIAKLIKRHHSTVSRELKRQSPGKYKAEEAQKRYLKSKNNCGRKSKKQNI